MTTGLTLAELPSHVTDPDPSIYWSDNYVVVDFETTTDLKGSPLSESNRIVLACWKQNGTCVRSNFGGEYDQASLVSAVEDADFIVAHNAKFELGWLRRCGISLREVVSFDTLLAEYVLGGNRFKLIELGLGKCLERHGLGGKKDTVGNLIRSRYPVEDIPEKWLERYCKRDVEGTEQLFLAQREILRELGLEAVNYQRNLVTPCLADIEFNGMQLDEEAVLKYVEEKEQEFFEAERDLEGITGGVNLGSPKQAREYIFNNLGFDIPKNFLGKPSLTSTGEASVGADVMERLRPRTSRQRKFLDYHRRWTKCNTALSKYLRKFRECCTENSGRLLGVFNQAATRTHRLSSAGLRPKIQFHNLPREFKRFFRSRFKGWSISEADASQLEFRAAAHLGRDKVALRNITTEGFDVHRLTADTIGCSRQEAKPHTFKPLYGGASGSAAERKYYQAFKDTYKGIADTQMGWTQTVLRNKKLRTEWGLIYYWPNTRMTQSGYITNTTSIYNYPVQAFATAEIIPCSLVCTWHRMAHLKSFIVNTVHDSIIAEIHPNEIEIWKKICETSFLKDTYQLIETLYGVTITVPLAVEIKIGDRWGQGDEIVYEADEKLWKSQEQ